MERLTAENIDKMAAEAFPEWVLDITDSLIASKWRKKRATLKFKEVREALMIELRKQKPEEDDGKLCNMISDNGWIDIEEYYRTVGFKVEVDNPAYNESYEGYFTFTKAES